MLIQWIISSVVLQSASAFFMIHSCTYGNFAWYCVCVVKQVNPAKPVHLQIQIFACHFKVVSMNYRQ